MAKNFLILILVFFSFSTFSQQEEKKSDTIKKHSPHKAAVLSAILPGAGQIYNRKYWKAPIVWGALGTAVYFTIDNTKIYNGLKNEYIARLNGKSDTVAEICDLRNPVACPTDTIFKYTNKYRRWRDISVIATTAIYVLQIIDAAVDAHLFYFDVSDDLSLVWSPNIYFLDPNSNKTTFGLAIQLQF
ncbi:MAG: DUF5683 domain-containing protein [Bacteroidia bacterium]